MSRTLARAAARRRRLDRLRDLGTVFGAQLTDCESCLATWGALCARRLRERCDGSLP
ncbi:hypothetical protein OG735_35455 [Streptomyces sp. NBC_01210]|uniref:hypothetical protein n=1 Tax=Streptomyces sp. NBC_01210 TaxID=2903774 RepID=UPI002E100192|nr:hypothetical protein OG735_35455 [Streptomyces sp. NBC_01210]